jgi:hypothetical protein
MGKARRKGNRSRNLAKKELEKQGWLVDVVEKTSKWAKEKDLFSLFDLIALKPRKIMLIQINTNTPKTHKPFQEFANKYASEEILIQQMTHKDYKGWKIKNYEPKITLTK